MTWFPLKDYQKETLNRLAEYCTAVRGRYDRGVTRFERDAYEHVTGRGYFAPPGFENVPYICLRLPTGGGKTLLAAHALGTIGDKLLGTDRPACLWITPSTTIRDQTLRALQRPTHPYRTALQQSVDSSVEVVTLEEALTRPRSVQGAAALVIVTTIQSYRIRDERSGEELAATRRIYRDNGYLQAAFENLPAWAQRELSRDENGLVNLSLANALRLRRPIVILDEAHNARTPVSFESLARFGPSFVLELTATPEQRHDPQHPTDPRFASNVLHAVSALELKKEGMIKLPVDLESRGDWLEVLAATVQRRNELETVADRANRDIGLPFLRPIALIQAQPSFKTKDTHSVDEVKAALIERLGVPAEEVRICTGTIDEIGDTDLMADTCPVRYVITVDKLREGWDCPLAYVLGSIGNAATPTAVEQLIGRVLRMPNANPTRVAALDRAYAFVLSDDVLQTAMQLRDRMVETCGFDERSAEDALRVAATQTQRGLRFGRIPLSQAPDPGALPPLLAAKTRYDESSRTLVVDELLTRDEVKTLRDAAATEADRRAIEDYWERERPVGIAAKVLDQYARPVRVPRLVVEQAGRWSLLEPVELDSFAWNLDACDFALTEAEFEPDIHVGSAATIDIREAPDGRGGGLFTEAAGDVRLRQLELIGEGEDWNENELTLWLDRAIHRGDALMGLALSESQPWVRRAVTHLTQQRRISLPTIVRRRHRLADVLRTKIADHGRLQTRRATDWLIENRPEAIKTSDEHAITIEEDDYAPSRPCDRRHIFKHHAFDQIFEMNGEEVECATHIDGHPNVARWIRNTEHATQGGFWLPKSPGRFFPDFIVELKDGRIVLVEYKMGKLASDPEEQHKKAVGELWASRSDNRCRFAWIVDTDWRTLTEILDG
jgi:type III restriction enzyme